LSERNKYWDRNGPLAQLLESLLRNNNIPSKLKTAEVQKQFTQFKDIPEKNFCGILSRYRARYCSESIAKIIVAAEKRKNKITNNITQPAEVVGVNIANSDIQNNLLNNIINSEDEVAASNNILTQLSK
jgi:hypothetical protein